MARTDLMLIAPTLLALASVAACRQVEPAATDIPTPSAPEATTRVSAATRPAADSDRTENVFPFRIGALEAFALKDGDIAVPNDGKAIGVGQPAEAVAELLKAAGLPTDVLQLSIQPLLVRNGEQALLFDTGAGDASFAKGGKLLASLRAAGIKPAQITDIFISHKHDDHVGGLMTRDGALAFPNATIHLSAPEWKAMQADANAGKLVAAIAAKIDAFQPRAELIPGVVTAVTEEGHTPGHSAYMIGSGNDCLLYIGDTAHHYIVSVQRPDWTIAFDENAPLAQKQRRALLQRAADENLHAYAVHFPYPGLGHIKANGEGFQWIADP